MIRREWVSGDDFTQVSPDLVRSLGGDVAGAAVLARLRFRLRVFGYTQDGHTWWRVSVEHLGHDVGLSVSQTRRALAKLEQAGVVFKAKHHQQGAYDQTTSYAIAYDTPETETHDTPRNDVTESPTPLAQDDKSHLSSLTNVPIEEVRRTTLKPAASGAGRDDRFADFWAVYPKRKDKGHAVKAWAKAVTKADPQEIIDGASRYANHPDAHRDGGKWLRYPATWLNGECWADEDTTPTTRPAGAFSLWDHKIGADS